MAFTEFGTNDAQTVKLWTTKLAREGIGRTYCRRFMGSSDEAIIQVFRDLESGNGDTIKYDLLYQMTGPGVDGDTRLKGFEEPLTYEQDELTIDQKRNAHNFRTMTRQRTVHNLRGDAMRSLADWFAVKFDTYGFAYLCGSAGTVAGNPHSVVNELPFAGNPLEAPDAGHLVDKTGATMSVKFIDAMLEKAKVINPLIRPVMFEGRKLYVVMLHPYQATELRTVTGDDEWKMIQARARERGRSNPIFHDALGEYAGAVIHESEYMPRTSAPLTHGLLLGAQSGVLAFGNSYRKLGRRTTGKGSYFSWFEDVDDYGNETGVGAGAIFGLKKCRFQNPYTGGETDFGVIRLDTDDIAHG